MIGVAIGIAAAAQSPALVANKEPVEIIVQAVREKCRVKLADQLLSEAELSQQAEGWVGRPVRVVSPRGAGYKCLARIVFRLNDKGVRLIQFVDPPERP